MTDQSNTELLYYFSYGSNMSRRRLLERVPSAQSYKSAALTGHQLKFHKVNRDGSGKCDIQKTSLDDDIVYGVIYTIAPAEVIKLDQAEGLGHGYDKKDVKLTVLDDQSTIAAFTYYATDINPALKPYSWYKNHVLIGATEHGLPEEYIQGIKDVEESEDPKGDRDRRERQIYE